ncbi:homocysteine S-methyltransferase family protein [Anaerovorax odorimutans]|uniref:homocysteine S-methyltransferase family protein n=1 Tax=Anaerovorax odorimutans TaxID=109327 RepID=UPI00042594ED|nr:homocysteine S-methyltransferase family protein [Anaerovorax odorimutans]
MSIRELIGKKIVICDGAMGTMIQEHGINTGEKPEEINFAYPDVIKKIYMDYLEAGSDFVASNTFSANRYKIAGTAYSVEQVVTQAVKIARDAVDEYMKKSLDLKNEDSSNIFKKYVALDIAPIGKLMKPVGDMSFDEAYDIFKEQILAGDKAGADLILFETFTDIHELKAGILAAKEACDLPIFCSVTFQEDKRMLMGTDPLTVVTILQDLGIDALGVNCSLGPKDMVPIVKEILTYSRIPVLVQPNAGLPDYVDGKTVFNVEIKEFTDAMLEMIEAGIAIAGGCCGTNPDYIRELAKKINEKKKDTLFPALSQDIEKERANKAVTSVSSGTKTVVLDDRIRIIGERINPTGKKLLKEALKAEDLAYIENEAINQANVGAEILDINVGLPEIDEKEMMIKVIEKVSSVVNIPLQIDSSSPEVIEAAVRIYNGKPIINSVNGKQEVMDAIFPIVKKYGACVIALTLDENGLPKNAEERIKIAQRIINTAKSYGIGRERIIVDCLTLTVSAQQNAGRDTLEAIRNVKQKFGVKTTLGASNVSFGLPQRKLLNRTFLAMALEAGLDAPITDPLVSEYVDTIRAFETLSCKDIESRDFIAYYSDQEDSHVSKSQSSKNNVAELTLEDIIIKGYEDRAAKATEELLKTMEPLEIVEQKVIPALEVVGKSYEEGKSFLPQLIKSADTVRGAFDVLKAAMEVSGQNISYGKIIVATVKGDIHDIGKNIVKVLLENYGYDVIDLGKDVEIETIVRTAKEQNIKMVGLSALMTTTVVNMDETIKALKEENLDCCTIVGGAVLTPEYAKQIGADFYCKDAMDAVRVANKIFKE